MDSTSRSLAEFQRNTAFIIVVILGGLAAFVYLTKNLVDVVVPLVWSAFFAVPLTGLIYNIDGFLTSLAGRARWGGGLHQGSEKGIPFTAKAGRNRIAMQYSDEVRTLLKKLEHPFQKTLCFHPSSRCCQSRIRITFLEEEGDSEVSVNRLMKDWHYFVREVVSEHDELQVEMELFLDRNEEYPAVISLGDAEGPNLKGTLELDRSSVVSWTISVLMALVVLIICLSIFSLTFFLGVQSFQQNIDGYARGVDEASAWGAKILNSTLPASTIVKLQDSIKKHVQSGLPGLAASIATQAEALGMQVLLFLLYIMFWIFEPIPMNSNVAQVIKSYLLLKTFVCVLFGAMMSFLMYSLSCPLWPLFFLISFLFNYIPELGFIVVFLLMIPAIFLDGHLPAPVRERNTVIAIVVSLLIKVLTANVIEVQIYASKGGQYMRMHPVCLMALMFFCQRLLGVSGMFLAIPIVAAVKYYLLSADVPSCYLNPVLVALEGDEVAPHKNFVDRNAPIYGATNAKPIAVV
jgi:predicted PurR-regulated permease PerM